MSKQQEKPPASKETLQHFKQYIYFTFLQVTFAHPESDTDPPHNADPDPADQNQFGSMRIRIRIGFGRTELCAYLNHIDK